MEENTSYSMNSGQYWRAITFKGWMLWAYNSNKRKDCMKF